MKAVVVGACLCSVAAVSQFVPHSGHDYDAVIAQPPSFVAPALADALVPSNSGLPVEETLGTGAKVAIDRNGFQSVHARLFINGQQASAVILRFEPMNGGTATHVTGDLDIDPALIDAAQARMGAQNGLAQTPKFALKAGFGQAVEHLARQLDRGESIAGQPINFTLAVRSQPLLK